MKDLTTQSEKKTQLISAITNASRQNISSSPPTCLSKQVLNICDLYLSGEEKEENAIESTIHLLIVSMKCVDSGRNQEHINHMNEDIDDPTQGRVNHDVITLGKLKSDVVILQNRKTDDHTCINKLEQPSQFIPRNNVD